MDKTEQACQAGVPSLAQPERDGAASRPQAGEPECSTGRCIHELVELQVERTPEAVAVAQDARGLSYRELNEKANQFARYLRNQGVGSEVRVGICLQRSFDLAVALLGVLKAGGACLPLDPHYPRERLKFMLQDAEAALLVTEQPLAEIFQGMGIQVVCMPEISDAVAGQSTADLSCGATPENLAYVIYTSGSTGTPRGVLLAHAGLVNHITAAIQLYDIRPTDRVLQFSSISFDIAIEELFPAWSAGAAVVLRADDSRLDTGSFLEEIREQGVTVLDLPTAYWHELVHGLAETGEPLPESLRLVIVGGEQPCVTTFAAWLRLGGHRVRWINTYGPTETSVIATAYEPGIGSRYTPPAVLPIGRPIANVQVHVLDENLNSVAVGTPGELHIGGVGLARGYLNRPELTAERFIPNLFSRQTGARLYKTGDLARYNPDGELEFLGRLDDQVKIRGVRVEPGEIECVLRQHAAVRDAVVIAREDSGEKRLVAYVVSAEGSPVRPAEWRAFLKQKMPEFMVPSQFVSVPALPLTPNGKVDRNALPNPESHYTSLEDQFVAPRDNLEARMVQIWEEVLQKHPIGVRHNFFDLGGESLLAVRLMHRIEQQFGRELPLSILLEASTPEQLAEIFRQQPCAAEGSSLVPIATGGSKPPLFCVHGQGGAVLRFRELVRHLGQGQPFYGVQARGLNGQDRPYTRVEEMAAHYLRDLRAVEPSGPYFLAGYSFGGLVAFEMAQQLQAAGERVALLALIDAEVSRPLSQAARLAPFRQPDNAARWRYLVRRATSYSARFRRRVFDRRFARAAEQVRACCQAAERAYVPRFYSGRIVLFRASQTQAATGLEPWRDLAASVEVFELSGDHSSILQPPEVERLAQQLCAAIDFAWLEHVRRPQVAC